MSAVRKPRGLLATQRRAEADAATWLPALIEDVAKLYRTVPTEVMGRGREARIANARHTVYWSLREAGLSLPAIGRVMDRDHSTVLSGIRKVDADPGLLTVAYGVAQAHVPALAVRRSA